MNDNTPTPSRAEVEKLVRRYRDLFIEETFSALAPRARSDGSIQRDDNQITVAYPEIAFHVTITVKRGSPKPDLIRQVLDRLKGGDGA